ncbi:Cof-type HAD-IIB family hydrolase [Neobacillus cucumis]|uniref:Cof-type HAD-IIB family hydrolase n=1 Tax=Neobacillus cucumis TaxID=1740721 RepID=UPI002E1AF235|nr:Cof-type HAD-IIB family hydrolase [Neobacillus cucumis]
MKLIALDLDGTTLNSKKEISEETLQAIKKAQQQGHIVMALSGRSEKSINGQLTKYGLNCPVGASNGTALYADGKLLELTSLSLSQTKKIALEIEKESVPFNMATNKGHFAPRNWDQRLQDVLSSGRVPDEYYENQYFKMFTTSPLVHGHSLFDQIEEIIDNSEYMIQKFLIVGLDPEQKTRLQTKLEAVEEITIASSSPFNLEVTHINGHKGTGLKIMADYFNIPIEDTVAIGDERNDIPMLKAAGLSIAMGNAEEEVKQHSDIVTLSNDEHGVAYAIEKYILTEK